MIKLFQSNGLRFYDTLNSSPNYRQRAYSQQRVAARAMACYKQPVDFSDISRVQAWSDSQVTLRVYSSANVLLYTLVVPFSHDMDGTGIYNATIDWATITNLDNGSYVTVANAGGELWRTEPLEDIRDFHDSKGFLKIIYSNRKDNFTYGSYRKCFEQILYVPAVLWEYDRTENEVTYIDSSLRKRVLKHDFIPTAKLHTDPIPYYLHDLLRDALNHDTILIDNEVWQKHNEGYKISHQMNASIHLGECLLREADTAVKRIVAQRSNYLALPPTLLPETNIGTNTFTANWEDNEADSYDVQLSTTPDFSSIVVSVNTTNTFYVFSGLTACTKYYYRVRAVTCAGVSAWANNEIRHQISLHFRGANKTNVIEMFEKVTDLQVFNIFNNAANLRYKYAPVHGVTNWSIYPYLTLSQVQTQINLSTGIYSLYYEIDNYVVGTDAGVVLDYIADTFWINVGCLVFETTGINQRIVLYFKNKVQFDAVLSTNGSTYWYTLVTSASGDYLVNNASNLTALNNLIATVTGEYAVVIFVEYLASVMSDITTLNIAYLP
jgi:hypothetical protein